MATVLLVEDNEDVRDMMSVALQLAGHQVVRAANGCEALRLLHEQPPPGVILMDLMMPVMDGWQLRAALRHEPRLSTIPVIVVSALSAEMADCLEVADFLPKPVDIDRLVETVSQHCR